MYDLKIPLGMMSEILIVRNRLKRMWKKSILRKTRQKGFWQSICSGNSMSFPERKLRIKTLFLLLKAFLEIMRLSGRLSQQGTVTTLQSCLRTYSKEERSAGVPLMDIYAGWMTMAYLMTFQESVIRNVIFIFRSGISRKGLLISSISLTRLLMPQKNTLRLQSKRSAGTLLQILKTKEKNYDLKSKIQIQQTYRHK